MMKATKIYYERIFPVQQFVNEKVGIEITIEGNETPEQAYESAKEYVWNQHKKNNPHLYHEAPEVPKMDWSETLDPYAKFDTRKKVLNLPDEPAIDGDEYIKKGKTENLKWVNHPDAPPEKYSPLPHNYEQEKISKGTIEEQIQAFTGTPEELMNTWHYVAKMNPKYKKIFDAKFKSINGKTTTV